MAQYTVTNFIIVLSLISCTDSIKVFQTKVPMSLVELNQTLDKLLSGSSRDNLEPLRSFTLIAKWMGMAVLYNKRVRLVVRSLLLKRTCFILGRSPDRDSLASGELGLFCN